MSTRAAPCAAGAFAERRLDQRLDTPGIMVSLRRSRRP